MLEGKLSDFSLPDLFQLLALTKKSGTLNINARESRGRIVFVDGEVGFAVADAERVAVGPRLIQAGLASREDISAILEARRAEGASGSLSQALLHAVELEDDERDAFVRSSIADAVFELMRVDDASFSFDTRNAEAPGEVTVATDQLVAEGERRLGEWAAIRERIPSADAVLAISPAAGSPSVTVSPERWAVLALVDGRRAVREVVDLSGQGEFTTTQLLAGMVADGLLEVAGEGSSPLTELRSRHEELKRIEAMELGTLTKTAGIARAARPALDPSRVAARREAAPTEQPLSVRPSPRPAPAVVGRPPAAEPGTNPTPAAGPERTAVVAEAPPQHSPGDDNADASVTPASELIAELIGGDSHDSETEPSDRRLEDGAAGSADSAEDREAARHIDRSQVARELASLGLSDDLPARAAGRGDVAEAETLQRLSRDDDVNKGLLLRLIDGVKGA